jgi:endonuclease YncB( thermonuclease family)
MRRRKCLLGQFLAAFSIMSTAWVFADPELSGSAFIQENGTLKIGGRFIHLHGIYIPPSDQTCHTFIRPAPCGPRAVLALEFKISGNSVHCIPQAENADGSIVASCSVNEEDLSAWMLQHGWALARPGAPFEYEALERIAQAKGIGIWGIPIDTFPHPGLRK